jgi:hypothetical protein
MQDLYSVNQCPVELEKLLCTIQTLVPVIINLIIIFSFRKYNRAFSNNGVM